MYKQTKELKELQVCQLGILKQIDKVCKENGIEYFLFGGTLLGAIRHHGFIPWDDDLDIAMMRADFDKFIDIASLKLPDYLFIQNYKTDDYPFVMTKVRNSRTTFIEPHLIEKKINHGVFVDIMVMDNVPNKIKDRKKFEKKLKVLYNMIHFGRIKKDTNHYSLSKKVFNALLNLISLCSPLDKLIKVYNQMIIKYKDVNTDYVGHTTKGVPCRRSYLKSDILPLTEIRFEDGMFPVPNNYDAMLKKDYGDYMTLPKEEKQHPNHSYFYDIYQPYSHYLLTKK